MLLPSGGYKGYGLGMMVEVFCGILAGAQYSKHVRTWKVTDRVANLVRFLFVVFLVFCCVLKRSVGSSHFSTLCHLVSSVLFPPACIAAKPHFLISKMENKSS